MKFKVSFMNISHKTSSKNNEKNTLVKIRLSLRHFPRYQRNVYIDIAASTTESSAHQLPDMILPHNLNTLASPGEIKKNPERILPPDIRNSATLRSPALDKAGSRQINTAMNAAVSMNAAK